MITDRKVTNMVCSQRGSTLVEYVVGASLLVAIIVASVQGLHVAASGQAERSLSVVQGVTPCNGELSGDECL